MRVILHPKVDSDIDAIMDYYERVASHELADNLLHRTLPVHAHAAEKPKSFSIRQPDLRRVNLQRFPYHFLFPDRLARS